MDYVRLLGRQVEEINQALAEAMKEHVAALHRLTKIPGVDLYAVRKFKRILKARTARTGYTGSAGSTASQPGLRVLSRVRAPQQHWDRLLLSMQFLNRRDAGRQLATKLAGYADDPSVLVLGLPRGGIPVAYEVARALHASLDVLAVRKLGVPGHRELAMGAIATGGLRVLNLHVIEALGISPAAVESVAETELLEMERQQRAYRGSACPPELSGRSVIVVDDGLATGSTMRAAVGALRQSSPARIIVAVPVAAAETMRRLREEADSVVYLIAPPEFHAVSSWYENFSQISDDQVRTLLEAASHEAFSR